MKEQKNHSIFQWVKAFLLAACLVPLCAGAQTASDLIYANRFSIASNYSLYPDTTEQEPTPPPAGKHPFYISHYGRYGSQYLSRLSGYEIPYKMLCHADSMKKLTRIGRDVLGEMREILGYSEGRWGDLSGYGRRQIREITGRMILHFPEVFCDTAFVDAYSTTTPRCVLSMGTAVLKMKSANPLLRVKMQSSLRDMWYLNYQDYHLRDSMMTYAAKKAYERYCAPREKNPRIMEWIFNDSVFARQEMNEVDLNYYLLKTALMQQNTIRGDSCGVLINLFTYEDIHNFWQKENAWWYINYGPSLLNGGNQPFTQRHLLRKIIQDADSVLRQDVHGATLRFGHETVVLPLVCLLGLNGYDYRTLDLESLEESGWWACLVFPMASNLQFVFYRSGPDDDDVVFKVLLNEKEATLPIPSDIAPYYHWRDFRSHYLQKLDAYESSLRTECKGVHSHLPHHGQKPVGTGR